MSASSILKDQWMEQASRYPNWAVPELTDTGLILGAGTCLVRSADGPRQPIEQNRLTALLAVVYRGTISSRAINHIDAATKHWRMGEKALANIRLSFARLPALSSLDNSYRLFLADLALSHGISPEALLKELMIECSFDSYSKFDPAQARVASGQGPQSGQWTSSGAIKPHDNESLDVRQTLLDTCEGQYEIDLIRCRKSRNKFCYGQATERYSACLNGNPIPPFPY